MDDATAECLMQSIAANRLIVLCGAGLSMAPPSSAPSAAAVARECSNKYTRLVGQPLPSDVQTDIEKMASWFREQNRFDDLFIHTLVPWDQFNVVPNPGHEAVADFLACGVVFAGITTNFDRLIEVAARSLGEPDFQAIVDVADLPRTFEHQPYLKVHGCCAIGTTRLTTVWCKEQLECEPIKERTARFRNWLQAHLLDRDLLIVGFWSDWAYLSEIFADTVDAIGPRSVFLVDPRPPDQLQAKAPNLWAWVHRNGITFHHEPLSGAEFLHSLRAYFSRAFLRQAFNDAARTYQSLFHVAPSGQADRVEALDMHELYALRRDLTGTIRSQPVRFKEAKPEHCVHTALHVRLLELGANYRGHVYEFGDEVVRLVQGGGQVMSEAKRRYQSEPPLPILPTRVVCVGATTDAAPANIVRSPTAPGVIRSGLSGEWVTEHNFISELETANA